jgi:hypothetical protein
LFLLDPTRPIYGQVSRSRLRVISDQFAGYSSTTPKCQKGVRMRTGSAPKRVCAAMVVVLAFVLAESAGAAATSFDQHGTTLIDGQKVFPIVLAKGPERDSTTPSGADALNEVVAAGVNLFKVGPASSPWSLEDQRDAVLWNQEAAARGVYTWVNLATLANATPETPVREQRLRDVIGLLEDDPALAMWKGADEPYWADFPPAALQYAYCVATSRGNPGWCLGRPVADSDHLWVTIQAPRGQAADLAPYSPVTDIHGVDDYPVTWEDWADPNLHEVGQYTDIVASITPSHAVWTTLQVCASGSSGPNAGEFVVPSRRQERYMIYDAILNGARNLAFYGGNINRCWTLADAELGWNWTFWKDVLKGLIQEINADSPIAPALVNPGSTNVLTSSDATTQVISREGKDAELWVIAARHGAGSQQVTISGLPSTVTNGTVYMEHRALTVADGSFTDTFEQWDVHVYRFTVPQTAPPPPPQSPPPQSPTPPPAPSPPAPPSLLLTRDTTPPNTRLTAAPSRRTRAHRARFRFVSTEAGSRFQCKLDRGRWTACRSPRPYSRLRQGLHVFRVRARDGAGNADPTPAVRFWRIR